MTVRVKRSYELDYNKEQVWKVISDHELRAEGLTVVDDYEVHNEQTVTWVLSLDLPLVPSTLSVKTREQNRDPPEEVAFKGKSKAFTAKGKHKIEQLPDGGCILHSSFVVEGRLPGVERFFKRNLESELQSLVNYYRDELDVED